MATAAASLDRCSVPNRGKQESLPYEDLEYGMGWLLYPIYLIDTFED